MMMSGTDTRRPQIGRWYCVDFLNGTSLLAECVAVTEEQATMRTAADRHTGRVRMRTVVLDEWTDFTEIDPRLHGITPAPSSSAVEEGA